MAADGAYRPDTVDEIAFLFGAGKKSSGGAGSAPTEAPNTLRSRQMARILELISEGEIEGPAIGGSWEKSTFLDKVPIKAADNTLNYPGISLSTRVGTPSQTSIDGFASAETTIGVNTEVLQATPVVRRVTNAAVGAARVSIQTPGMTIQDTATGNLNGSEATIKIEVKADATNGASVYVEKIRDTISGKTTRPYTRGYRVPLEGVGPWDIRVSRISADEVLTTRQNKTFWASYTEIVDRKLAYPYSALAALTVNSELFGDRIPQRGFEIFGIRCLVPSNYNPTTRVYTGIWDGTFTTAWTDNPCWILYDLILADRYGVGELFSSADVNKWALYQLSQYCDANNARPSGTTEDYHVTTGKHGVPDGSGNYEPRFKLNCVIASREDALKVLQAISGMMRAAMLWASGSMSFIQDRPKSATRVFSPANVIDGMFNYSGSSLNARHTAVFVSWVNPEKDYEVDTLIIEDQVAIARYGYNPLEITAFGCTSYSQAYRTGLYVLATEKLETDSVQFQVGLADADMLPGEIIRVNDPTFTIADFGGRLAAGTTTTLTLDRPFEFVSGRTYNVTFVKPDGTLMLNRAITNPGTTTSTVTFSSAISAGDVPVANAMFSIDSDLVVARKFRVMQVTEEDGVRAKVFAVQYDESKFDLIDTGVLPRATTADFADLPPPRKIGPPTNIDFSYLTRFSSGVSEGELTIAWDPPADAAYLKGYRVRVQISANNWESFDTFTPELVLKKPELGFVRVMATSLNFYGAESTPVASSIDLSTGTVDAKDVLYGVQLKGGGTTFTGRDVHLEWKYRSPYTYPNATAGYKPHDPVFSHFRIEVWNAAGTVQHDTFTTGEQEWTLPIEKFKSYPAARAFKIKLYAVDKGSTSSAVEVLDISNAAPATPTGVVTARAESLIFDMDQPTDADFAGWIVWMSTSPTVALIEGNVKWRGAGSPIITATPGTTYYYRMAAYDQLGETGLNVSAETSVTAPSSIAIVATSIVGQGDLATTNRAALPFGTNAFVNSNGDNGTIGWKFDVGTNQGSGTLVGGKNQVSGYGNPLGARNVMHVRCAPSSGNMTNGVYVFGPCQAGFNGTLTELQRFALPVIAGDRVYLRGLFSVHGGTVLNLRVRWWDGDGTFITESDLSQTIGDARLGAPTGAGGNPANYTEVKQFFVAPANARFASWGCYMSVNGTSVPDAYVFCTEPMMCRVPGNQTEAVPYHPGPPDRLADQTLANTAAAITGQGALATLSAVTEAVLAAGVGKNCIIDGDFRQPGTSYWDASPNASVGVASSVRYKQTTATGFTIGNTLYTQSYFVAEHFPCVPGDRIEVSAYLGGSNISPIQVFAGFKDAAGGYLTTTLAGSSTSIGAANGDLSTYTRVGGFVTAPANAKQAYILCYAYATTASPTFRVAKPYIGKAGSGQTQLTPWNIGFEAVPGADITLNNTAAAITGQGPGATAIANDVLNANVASPFLNYDAQFQSTWTNAGYPDPSKLGWANWSNGHRNNCVAGLVGPKAVEFVCPDTLDTGWSTSFGRNGVYEWLNPGWYVLEVDVYLVSGPLKGAGAYGGFYNAGFAALQNEYRIDFAVDADISGVVNSGASPATGRMYRYRKLVQGASSTIKNANLYAMANWGGFGGGTVSTAKTIQFHKCGLRPASDQERELGLAAINNGAPIGSITTNNARAQIGEQALTNTEFVLPGSYPPRGYVVGNYTGPGTTNLTLTIQTLGSDRAVKGVITGTATGSGYMDLFYGPYGNPTDLGRFALPVVPGDTVGVSAYVTSQNLGGSGVDVAIYWHNSSGIYVGEDHSPANTSELNGDSTIANYGIRSRVAIAPAGAAFASLFVRAYWVNGNSGMVAWAAKPMLCKLPAGQTVVPPYAPGGPDRNADVTSGNTAAAITGQGALATQSSVNANQINAGTVSVALTLGSSAKIVMDGANNRIVIYD